MTGQTIRTSAVATCLAAALALPATAAAGTVNPGPRSSGTAVVAVHDMALPSDFTTDAQSSYRPAATAPTAAVPSVSREVTTVVSDHGSQTLAIILAALALGIALLVAAYGAVRVRPTLRGSLGPTA